jgi:two-component system, LytTR family, sensor kinase
MQHYNAKAGFGFSLNAQIAFWLITLFIVITNSTGYFRPSHALIRIIAVLCCHVSVFYLFYSWLAPVYFIPKKYIQFAVLALLIIAVFGATRWWVEDMFTTTTEVPLLRKPPAKLFLIVFSQGLIASFASLLRLSANHYQSQQKLAQLRQMHTETELLFLKSQLNPHFLFNIINNLYALALEKSDKTPDALLKLSNLLRYYLYECNKDKVPLKKEWAALLAYRELFELKYEKPLPVQMNFASETDALIEPMLLVPLLENCFKHSDIGSSQHAFIKVEIKSSPACIEATFENSYSDSIKSTDEPGGIGIASVQKRLQLNYPGKHQYTVTTHNNTYQTKLIIELV